MFIYLFYNHLFCLYICSNIAVCKAIDNYFTFKKIKSVVNSVLNLFLFFIKNTTKSTDKSTVKVPDR